jgi:PST family polysaccharide transporter
LPDVEPDASAGPAAPPSAASSVDVVDLQRRARLGLLALAARTVLMQLTMLGGDVYLRRRLEPADFGLYAIVQFALAVFMQFGDVGLASAMIRQQEKPTRRQLSSAWTLQMLVAITITVVLWLGAPLLRRFWPDMSENGIWVLRALSVDVVLSSARLIPSLLMERDLEYGKLSVLDVVLNGAYYVAAVALAATGHGVMSLAFAVIVRGTFGVVGAYALRPFRPSVVLDLQLLRPIMHFGVRFQAKSLVGFLSSAIAPVYAGRVLGQAQLGFINLGQSTAYFPLRLVEVMARVSFPLFSRLQGEPQAFAKALERGVVVSAMGTLFFVGLVAGLGPNLLIVVYGQKWMPALPLLYVYAGALSVGFLFPVVSPALDALGKVGVNLRLSIGWAVSISLCVALLTPRWGSLGFAIGYCVPMVLGNLIVVVILKRLVPDARLWPRVRALIVGGCAVALVGHFVLARFATRPISFSLSVLASAVIFLAVVGLLDRSAIGELLSLIRPKRSTPA